MKIYFLIPVFNEEENIAELYANLAGIAANSEKFYLFVDDYSTDATVEVINNLFKNSKYHIVKKSHNIGPGDSFNIGFNWILTDSESDDDIIITMEGDNTSECSLIYQMIEIINLGYDLVLASPYAQGGGFEKTSFTRKILSFSANMVLRVFFDIKILTLSSFFRAYKINLLKSIADKYGKIIDEKGFISMLEILIKSIRLNSNIIEIPMVLKSEKRKGKSKMKIYKTGIDYFRFILFNKIK